MLDQFSPMQRQLLLAGVPAVGVAALLARARKGATPPAVTGQPIVMGTGDAISVGELATWQSGVAEILNDLQQSMYDMENRPVTTPTTPPENQTPAPVTSPVVAVKTPQQLVDIVYGSGFQNNYEGTGQAWAPAPAAGGVVAPPGGVLSGGQWEGNVLVSGTYVMPDGSYRTVRI